MHASRTDLDRLTRDLPTKSEKIRTLGQAGVATADIARFLDIRYQHARNVLVQAGLHGPRDAAFDKVATGPRPPQVAEDGSLTLSAEVLRAAGFAPGAEVVISPLLGGIEILTPAAALARARELVARYVPAGSRVVDDLIAERRREATNEVGRDGGGSM